MDLRDQSPHSKKPIVEKEAPTIAMWQMAISLPDRRRGHCPRPTSARHPKNFPSLQHKGHGTAFLTKKLNGFSKGALDGLLWGGERRPAASKKGPTLRKGCGSMEETLITLVRRALCASVASSTWAGRISV